MNQKRWQEMEPIIDKALSFQKNKRRKEYIRHACKNDEELLDDTMAFLSNIKKAKEEDFLTQ
ncbi:MAG: hypothetical protein U5J95_06435 [Balneolaceae bacterium]|nr:hypothetical protein [Balneolaceae bacterium]